MFRAVRRFALEKLTGLPTFTSGERILQPNPYLLFGPHTVVSFCWHQGALIVELSIGNQLDRTKGLEGAAQTQTQMASPLLAGLGVAAAAYTAKQLVQLYAKMKAAPPAMRAFYKGGFEPVMTRIEASRILGLRSDAPEEKVKEAHRRIMVANHPDSGGSSYIAAKVNMAKDLLLGKHKDSGLK